MTTARQAIELGKLQPAYRHDTRVVGLRVRLTARWIDPKQTENLSKVSRPTALVRA
jgi:hypothetical protein